ncbi:nitroreductase family protein, partial [Streptomyces tendae]
TVGPSGGVPVTHTAKALWWQKGLRTVRFDAVDGGPRLAADVGAYLQTLLLAMTAHGVASCPQGLLSFYADTVRAELGVGEGRLLVGVSFGYADETAAVNRVASGRAALDEVATFHG